VHRVAIGGLVYFYFVHSEFVFERKIVVNLRSTVYVDVCIHTYILNISVCTDVGIIFTVYQLFVVKYSTRILWSTRAFDFRDDIRFVSTTRA